MHDIAHKVLCNALHHCAEHVEAFALPLGQWILLAISGQTLGKKLLMIRIVSESGKLPGFLQAVVMRNWLRFAFSLIPFFAFIDVLFIFSDSRRCLHDYMAGTKVISLV